MFTRVTTRTVVLIIYFLAILCMSLLGPIERYGGYSQLYIFALGSLIWGMAGIPMIVRKEAQPFPEKGGWAVSLGVIHLVLGWGLGSYLLIYNLVFR